MPSGWFVGWTRESTGSELQPLFLVADCRSKLLSHLLFVGDEFSDYPLISRRDVRASASRRLHDHGMHERGSDAHPPWLGPVTGVQRLCRHHWRLTGRWAWLAGGALVGAVVPFTLAFIMSTNRLLLDAASPPKDD
jgi:hypothetical protein